MKIGIEASRAFSKNRTGIEEYSYQVVKHLMNRLKDHQVILYVRKDQNIEMPLPSQWRVKRIKWPYLWTQAGLSLELVRNPVDVLFIPAHTVPLLHPKKTIVTIHGLEYEFCPQAYSLLARLYMRWSIKASCRWATKIIAVSNNTKNDLVNLYKVPKEKIEVVYEGCDRQMQSANLNLVCQQAEMQNEDLKFKIGEKYLLFIGRLEERKNIVGIIRSFEILKKKYKLPHKLVLAGRFGYGSKKIQETVNNSVFRSDIILPGFVADEKKWKLLTNADVFLFPTFYEGFGLPILEAQSVGVPVVSGKHSSIPEVTRLGAKLLSALLVNPNDAEEIAEAVNKLIADKVLREEIISRGYENVKRFSWEKCAEGIAEILTK